MAHLVWDWNGTLLDDLTLVVAATNVSLSTFGGPSITADDHRRDFRRPITAYYEYVLGRPVSEHEFLQLDRVYHDAYREGLVDVRLAEDAETAMMSWPGTQSLLSMWFHDELVPEVTRRGLLSRFGRIDGLPAGVTGGGHKAEHLVEHLAALGVEPAETVLIGDSTDDAYAAGKVGAACVLYGGGFTHPDRLREAGVPVAMSLMDAVRVARTLVAPLSPRS